MNKIEQLKAAFEASTPEAWVLTKFFQIEAGKGLVCEYERVEDAAFICLAHNMMSEMLEALALLEQAAYIIDSEYPPSDERFDVAVKALALLEKLR